MDPEAVRELEPLSYFFGAWLGDGWLHANPMRNRYEVGIGTSDKEIVTRCFFIISNYFNDLRKPRFYEQNPKYGNSTIYSAVWSSKEFLELLYFATDDKRRLPRYIWEASFESQLEVLAGIMDTDGTISKRKNFAARPGYSYEMKLTGTRSFVLETSLLFNAVGIGTGKVGVDKGREDHHLDSARFTINLSDAVRCGFYFRCKRKMDRLQDYVEQFTDEKAYNAPDDGME